MTQEDINARDKIKAYCIDRLDEIDSLNKSQTLSAYSCYAWLIGVLSHLAYAGQESLGIDEKKDEKCYTKFVGSFMPGYDPTMMYKNFRCGLIHACSLDFTWRGNKEDSPPIGATNLFLTHNEKYRWNGKNFKRVQIGNVTSLVMYYKDLSDSIRCAIETMFEKEDIVKSAIATTKHQRFVEGLSEIPNEITKKYKEKNNGSNTSFSFAQLSGFYTSPIEK